MNHPLQVLGAVEVLLFLQQESVRHQGQSTCRLAVSGIGKGDAFVVGEVGPVILPLAALLNPCQLGRRPGGPVIGPLKQRIQLLDARVGSRRSHRFPQRL